uniref:Elongation factor P n=1 Tax=Magnetococcus massalia (strain MO-1) TaxID=451514 RepID=A0A1S7LE40_MAGMO|nr:Elongation factor P [Candidatus Magnetococcus massalia]
MLSHNQLKQGTKVLIDDQPWVIVKADFVKPGKGQAFTKIKIKNLIDGRVIERTFKSSDSVAKASIMEKEMQYLYSDGDAWHFMDPASYEQVALTEKQVEDCLLWLKEEETYEVTLWEDRAIAVVPPAFLTLLITHCEPGVKGDTVTGATKPATLETGAEIKVPLFVNEGERVKVDTRKGEYMERAKG